MEQWCLCQVCASSRFTFYQYDALFGITPIDHVNTSGNVADHKLGTVQLEHSTYKLVFEINFVGMPLVSLNFLNLAKVDA